MKGSKNKYKNLYQMFSEVADFTPTSAHCKTIINHREEYERRQSHPMALNSPYVAVYRMYFLPKDNHMLFDTFGVDKRRLMDAMKQCESINFDHKVITDPYNLLTMWVVHKLRRASNLSRRISEDTQLALIQMLQYKFFTSRANRLFPHGAREDVMMETVEGLSRKFDIKHDDTPTWYLVLQKRSNDILSSNSIHDQAFNEFAPDERVYRAISDIQTRIRNKLKLIKNEFNAILEEGGGTKYSSSSDEIDGDQVIRAIESKFDAMVYGVSRDVLTLEQLLDLEQIRLVSSMLKNVSSEMLRKYLSWFSEVAVAQYKNGEDEQIKKGMNNKPIYLGYRSLIRAIITVSYNSILKDRNVNPKSKVSILTGTINKYRASRISDLGIQSVKESMAGWVENSKLTSRDESKGGLRIAFIMYVMLQSFKHT